MSKKNILGGDETTHPTPATDPRPAKPSGFKPTVGRTVHYVLTEDDAKRINRRRTTAEAVHERIASGSVWPAGVQAHIGSEVAKGIHVAAVVTAAVPAEVAEDAGHDGHDGPVANLKCLLDGTDDYWVRDVREGTEPGTYHVPERD